MGEKKFRWGVVGVKNVSTFGMSQRSGKLKTTTMTEVRNTKGQEAFDFIVNSINAGKTIMISNHLRATEVTPKTYAKWMKSGHQLFKVNNVGALVMARGKNWEVIVTEGGIVLCKIAAY